MSKVNKGGRPSKLTDTIAEAICIHIADGKSLRTIEQIDGMPSMTTIMRWLADDRNEGFREQYARAREIQADALIEDILAVADNMLGDVGRDKLRIDSRKWLASKLMPKKYGDRLQVAGSADEPVKIERIETIIVDSKD